MFRLPLAALLFVSLLLIGCAMGQRTAVGGDPAAAPEASPPVASTQEAPAADHAGFMPTEEGWFIARVSPVGVDFASGANAATLELRIPSGQPVNSASVEVIPWMPLHGHGINARPTVAERGKGVYEVTGIDLPMAGLWQLRFEITVGNRTDSYLYGPFTTGEVASAETEYLKARSPAGYDVTLGVARERSTLEPEVSVDGQGRTVKHFRLTVEEVSQELYPGKTILGWGFNGQIPGPELRVTEGDLVRITLTNKVRDSHHTVHVHGLQKSVANDGVPFLGQKPTEFGEEFTYEFVAYPSGTSWYHCHVDSAHHVDMGMYGSFIVEEKEPSQVFDREYVWVLDEWPSAHEHMHEDTGMAGHDDHKVVTRHEGRPRHEHTGEEPKERDWYPETYPAYQPVYDTFLINGYAFPYTTPLEVKTGERVKIRIINAGYQSHFMHIHAHKFLVTHRDGRPLAAPVELDTVEVGPGQRADLILTATNPGIWPFHCHRLNHIANDRIYPGGMLTFLRYVDWVADGGEAAAPEGEENFFDDLSQ